MPKSWHNPVGSSRSPTFPLTWELCPVQSFLKVQPWRYSRDARSLEGCQVICCSSILSPGLLHIPQNCLPLPSPSPCRAAPQGNVLAKAAAVIHQALQTNMGRDRGTTGTGGRMPKVSLGCQTTSWKGCRGDHSGVWPQMERRAALTIFWKLHGTRQSTGRFLRSVCIDP